MDHIRRLNEWKKVYHSEFPHLVWQFVVFGHNQFEIPMARQMARELQMEFRLKMSWDSTFSPITAVELVKLETGWPEVTREDFERISGVSYMRDTCYSLWRSPHINWDGKVLGCCWNSWMEFGGNAFWEGYEQVINNDVISYARRLLRGRVPNRPDVPCSQCQLFHTLRNTQCFLTPLEIYPLAERYPHLHKAARSVYHWIKKRKAHR
jgi:hypothetical protein